MVNPDYESSLSLRKRNVVNMCWCISFFSFNRDCIVSQISFSSLEDLKMNTWMIVEPKVIGKFWYLVLIHF